MRYGKASVKMDIRANTSKMNDIGVAFHSSLLTVKNFVSLD